MGTRYRALKPLLAASAALSCMFVLAACDGAPSANAARSHTGDGGDRRLADNTPAGDETRAPARYSSAVYNTGSSSSASRIVPWPRTGAGPRSSAASGRSAVHGR